MIYNEFKGRRISALGMGTMRLPVIDGDDGRIDEAAAIEMVDYALAHGINYFDTAWGYHNGTSETVVGKALSRHPRDSFYLADKFPGYDLSNMGKVEEIFEEQLRKCQVDHFDFYLIHNVCELNIDAYLDPKYGTLDYLREQRRNGRISHLGFSVHGNLGTMKRFLDAYGDDMEFCQVQLNYIDWEFQDAKAKVALLRDMGIPCWVMEPVRGGRLANLTDDESRTLKAMRRRSVPCTSCHYCTSHCPKGLDIPYLIELYNEHSFTGGGFLAPMALAALPEEKRPASCIGCGKCAEVCPQAIDIPGVMSDFASKLGT